MVIATANVTDYNMRYQWYSARTNSNVEGSVISGATRPNLVINPETLSVYGGSYYYFCEILAHRNSVTTSLRSEVAVVNVAP